MSNSREQAENILNEASKLLDEIKSIKLWHSTEEDATEAYNRNLNKRDQLIKLLNIKISESGLEPGEEIDRIYHKLINDYSFSYEDIPKKYLNPEIIATAYSKTNGRYGNGILFIDILYIRFPEFLTQHFWLHVLNEFNDFQDFASGGVCKAFYKDNHNLLAALEQKGWLDDLELHLVPMYMRSAELCAIAIEKYAPNIKDVPEDILKLDKFRDAVNTSIEIVKREKKLYSAPRSILTEELCLIAVNDDWEQIKYVPERLLMNNCFKDAVSKWQESLLHDPSQISDVPKIILTSAICMAAIEKNGGKFLAYIPNEFRSVELCQAAIEKDPSIISLLSKHEDVPALTKKEYNYLLILALKKDRELLQQHILKGTHCEVIKLILDELPTLNILVTHNAGRKKDLEVDDAAAVFLKASKRQFNTLYINEHRMRYTYQQLSTLLEAIEKVSHVPIKLILLDHSNADNTIIMSGLEVSDITEFIRKYNIQKVSLLGCKTAQSKPLTEEESMISAHQIKAKQNYAGVILTKNTPTTENCRHFLSKLKKDFENEEGGTVYILVRDKDKNSQPKLIKFGHNGDEQQEFTLSSEQLRKLGKLIGNNKNEIPIPSKNADPLYYRWGQNSLELDKVLDIEDILASRSRFSRKNPNYKTTTKQTYPFLAGIKIDYQQEKAKLNKSFLTKLASEIDADSDIHHDVTIKGYNKLIHVDKVKGKLRYSNESLYKKDYDSGFFKTNNDIIAHDKIKKDRNKQLEKLRGGKGKETEKNESSNESNVKSITVVIKK